MNIAVDYVNKNKLHRKNYHEQSIVVPKVATEVIF